MIRSLRGVAALAVVLVASFGLAAPAFAHAELISTSPVDGAVLADAPTAITLTFGEGVETALGAIRLFDANGKAVAVGATGHPGGLAAKVQVSVPTLSGGTYLVSFRVVSADSHPVQGSFLFSVGQRSAIQPDAAATLAGSSPSRALGVLLGTSRFVVFAAFLLLAGSLAFTVLFTSNSPRMRTLVLVGAGGLALGSLAALVLQGGYASGTGLAEALHPAVWRATARTAFGRQALARVALAALGAALGLWIARAAAWWWQMASLLMGPALAVTLAWAGHAHTGRAIGLGLAADLVHLVALAWWLGGLVALTAVALGSTDRPAGEAHGLVARFSPLAFGCVVAVVVSGVAQSWRQVGSLDALSTDYGRLLLAKVAVVVLLLAAAAVTRRTLHSWTPADVTPSRLRRSVGAEVLAGVVVLGLTAGLVAAPPAVDQVAKPFNVTLADNGALANVVIDPARAGVTAVHLYITPPGGALVRAADARLELSMPSAGVEKLTVALDAAGPNHFTTENAHIPFKGRWQVAVIVRFGDFESHTFTTSVSIR